MKIGILGGTGSMGRGLSLRFATAGEEVLIGSRGMARAEEVAARLRSLVPSARVEGLLDGEVAQGADVVVIAVPLRAHEELLVPLRGALVDKVVITISNSLAFGQELVRVAPVPEGSSAQHDQALLPRSRLVAAFQNVSAVDLQEPGKAIEGDVLVCSDDDVAKGQVMALVRKIPSLRAVDAGRLASSAFVEGITALCLNLNRIHGGRSMIRIVWN